MLDTPLIRGFFVGGVALLVALVWVFTLRVEDDSDSTPSTTSTTTTEPPLL